VAKNGLLSSRHSTLRLRAEVLHGIRQFLRDHGYLEVETPHRIPAPAPESHIDAVPSGSWFLHTSPEICMKRLVAAGYERIFQICRCWREGERGSRHVPEFTLLEWYCSNRDYHHLMEQCEALVQALADRICMGQRLTFRGQEVDLRIPWERISVKEAFERYTQSSMGEALEKDLFDEWMVTRIEPNLGIGKPTFLYDYPSERAALACLKQEDPSVAERFELYLGGLELANAFSELVHAEEQRRRFESEQAYRFSMGKTPYPLPEKFLAELEGMPPSAGIALGVDRLVMVFADAQTIDEVVAFTPEEL